MTPALPALLLTLGLAASATAQPANDGRAVYRCGNGSYSSSPCPGGQVLDASDPRSAEQQEQARQAASREARLAQQLATERRARERAAAGQRAINIGPTAAVPAQVAASRPAHKKPKQPKQPQKQHAAKPAAP